MYLKLFQYGLFGVFLCCIFWVTPSYSGSLSFEPFEIVFDNESIRKRKVSFKNNTKDEYLYRAGLMEVDSKGEERIGSDNYIISPPIGVLKGEVESDLWVIKKEKAFNETKISKTYIFVQFVPKQLSEHKSSTYTLPINMTVLIRVK